MLLRDLIREYTQSRTELPPAPPARPVPQTHVCPKCKMESGRTAVEQGAMICPACGAYFRMNARERITHTFDAGSFQELDADVTSVDFLSFPGYAEKLEKAQRWVSRLDVASLFMLSVLPFAPSSFMHFAFGISDFDEKRYLITMLLGKGAMVAMMALFGQSIVSSLKNPVYLILAVVLWGGMYWASKQFCKKHDI